MVLICYGMFVLFEMIWCFCGIGFFVFQFQVFFMFVDMKFGVFDFCFFGERDKVLNLVLGQIECNFGKGLIMWLGDVFCMWVEMIFIGVLIFDFVLGGGYLKGCVVEIYGLESFGKIMFILYVIVEVQKCGGVVVFVDVEYVLDFVYVVFLGVDVENLLVFQFDIGEMVLEIVD